MDRCFRDLIEINTPKINRTIVDGLACSYVPKSEKYIDEVFISAAKSFPAGLEYVGYERCTPQEEYTEITRPKNNRRNYDLATNYLYMVKYKFRYNGVDLPNRYIQLPYVEDGGIIYLSGSLYHIAPVITDNVISPSYNSVFVRLLRDKIVFERIYHSAIIDGQRYTEHVTHSTIYRKPKNSKKIQLTTKAKTTAIHYLLSKYGFSGMFQKYLGFIPIIGEDEINEANYPKDKYVICQSIGLQPRNWISQFYVATKIRLAIPIDCWNKEVKTFVIGFYYVVDNFPNRIKANYVENTNLWKILLGHIIFSGLYGENRLYSLIEEHFESLDEYVDNIIIAKLKEAGYEIEDFYSLLALVVKKFNDWAVNAAETSMSIYNKTLEILYYVLYDITSEIFKTNFKLNKAVTKKKNNKGDGVLQVKEIIEIMSRTLKTGAIFGLTRENMAVSSASYSGDNKYPKITAILTLQQSTAGPRRGKKTKLVMDHTKRLHVSAIETGSLLFLSKSNPTPAVRANLFLNLNTTTGKIEPKDRFNELRENISNQLKGIEYKSVFEENQEEEDAAI